MSENKKSYFEFVKKLFEDAVDPRTFTNSVIEYMRVVLMIKSGIDDIKLLEITENERDDLKVFANHYSDDEIERILDYILLTEERIRSASNPRTIFEMRMLLLLNTDNLIRPVDIIASNMQAVSASVNEDYGFESANNNAVSQSNQPKPQYDVPLNPTDKRRIFYNKILSFIETESPTIYSLLSQGNPIESKGATLIVALQTIYSR
ncbi:hypothetical protein OGZ02_13245 [Brachyspira hyodysenteriae]|nr:hypothetical protein [Brachyspira hyodysenteriae]MDA1469776.1 hypothetical protein [Brachyspira hyodysenteriae]